MALYKQPGSKYVWCRFVLDGQYYRQSTKCTTRTAAQQYEDELRRQIMQRGGMLPRKAITLSEFEPEFTRWVKQCVKNGQLDASTETYYHVGWNVLLKTALAGTRLDRITTSGVAACPFGDSPTHRNNALRTLGRMLTMATEWGYLRVRPKIKLAKEWRREQLIEQWMEEKLLEVTAGTRLPTKKHSPIKGVNYTFQPLRDVLLLMLDAGMRPAEIFRMRWEHVLWDRFSICVPKGKSEKAARFVPLSDRIREALAVRCNNQTTGWVFPADSESGHLETVQKQFKAARTLAGIPNNVVLYCARHTFATNALDATGNVAAVMAVMGHSKVQMVMRYQHPELDSLREAMAAKREEQSEATPVKHQPVN